MHTNTQLPRCRSSSLGKCLLPCCPPLPLTVFTQSQVRIARLLRPGKGRLVCVEADPRVGWGAMGSFHTASSPYYRSRTEGRGGADPKVGTWWATRWQE